MAISGGKWAELDFNGKSSLATKIIAAILPY
jgi:hypothetical protein